MHNFSEKVSFIGSVADLLRGDYKQSEYGRVILPFTVLRRLDQVLAPSRDAVWAAAEQYASANEVTNAIHQQSAPAAPVNSDDEIVDQVVGLLSTHDKALVREWATSVHDATLKADVLRVLRLHVRGVREQGDIQDHQVLYAVCSQQIKEQAEERRG